MSLYWEHVDVCMSVMSLYGGGGVVDVVCMSIMSLCRGCVDVVCMSVMSLS